MSRIISRLRSVWKAMNEPPAPQCHQCRLSPPAVVLAPGAHFCAECSKLTPAELEAWQRSLPGLASVNPSPFPALRRRRDDPRQ